jgi:hypothetical protein
MALHVPLAARTGKLARRLLPPPAAIAVLLLVVAGLGGCVTPAPAGSATAARGCGAGGTAPMLAYELFFGRINGGGGPVTDSAWDGFLAAVVTPNLPDGYTAWNAAGAWRNPADGHRVREPSMVVLAVLPAGAPGQTAIARIRAAYAAQFHQASVGLTVTATCGAF